MGSCRIPIIKMKYLIGVDVGGTTITSVLVNSKKKIIKKVKFLTQRDKGKKIAIKNILESISFLIGSIPKNKIKGLGIAFPGLVDRKKGIVINCPNLSILNNTNIFNIIKKHHKFKCRIENDANCAALAEYRFNKKPTLVCLTLGTGLGSGIIINNKLYYGKENASEIGHITIEKNGLRCFCGNRGCLEEYVSVRAIIREAKKYKIKIDDIKTIAELARKNKKYRPIFEEFGRNLGIGLANIINIFDPDLIILTGGLSYNSDLFLKSAIKEMKSRARFKPCPIKVSNLKEYIGAFGATSLF